MTRTSPPRERSGSALVTVVVFAAILTILVAAGLTITKTSIDEVEAERHSEQSLYAAEAGINTALTQVALAYKTGAELPCDVGNEAEPLEVYAGKFWTRTINNADGTLTVLATGQTGGSTRTIEAILEQDAGNPMDHAMYAGNFSKDPAYGLRLGGTGGQRDEVTGDIYSGGDIELAGDATVDGDLTAGGTITGGDGRENVVLDVPQLLTIDYEEFHDVDVARAFEGAPRVYDNAGGKAGQLPESHPAHIFRKNPSDRTSNTSTTKKDDYFLEDPYERPTADWGQDGSNAFQVSLPEQANNSVYFIDGNLWLHSRKSFSLKLRNEGIDPTRVTFVVKGNVYFSDNLFYDDPDTDGVAFLALADADVEDSGNIYFGDPSFGTMQYAEGMLFAENNFFDVNLDASGSSVVEVRGNMTAGNQIAIERDYGRAHTKLKLTFDDRQQRGLLNLPGIPVEADHPVGFTVASWREIPTPSSFDLRDVPSAVGVPSAMEAASGSESGLSGSGGLGGLGSLEKLDPTRGGSTYLSIQETFRILSTRSTAPPDPFAAKGKDWRSKWLEKFGSAWKAKKRVCKWEQ